jgi:hypothetical protein
VTVRVGTNALIQVFVQSEMSQTGGAGTDEAKVHLFEPTLLPGAPKVLGSASNTIETVYTAPGSGDASGVVGQTRAGALTLSAPPGKYTFSLRYSADAGTATFQNRKLWVAVTQ